MMTGEKNDDDFAKVWKKAKKEARDAMIIVARARGTILYSELKEKIKSIPFEAYSQELFDLLDKISREEHKEERGMLSAVVVRKDSGRPGPGFFRLAEELGRDVSDKERFWKDEIRRVRTAWKKR